jgi:hypothetical protein
VEGKRLGDGGVVLGKIFSLCSCFTDPFFFSFLVLYQSEPM